MPIYLNNRRAAHAWISQTTITAGQLHIATRDGEAMVFHDSIDLSPYAGTDAGSTPYRLVFVDSAGKQAVAYGGAVGGGEALGAELVTNGGFDSDTTGWSSTFGEITSVSGGYSGNCCQFKLIDGGNRDFRQNVVVSGNSLLKVSFYGKKGSFSAINLNPYDITNGVVIAVSGVVVSFSDIWQQFTDYLTVPNGCNNIYFRFYATGTVEINDTCFVDEVSVKPYTDVPATGLHLMSAKNGTTRNMTLVESGFNPNLVTKVRIYA